MNEMKMIDKREILGKNFRMYGTVDEPLFLAKDVAEWIDYSKSGNGSYNVSQMLASIDDDEKLVQTLLVAGQNRQVSFLTENGLYEVLFQSRKPIAKQFKGEVKKVLKSIRTTGGYILANSEIGNYIANLEKSVTELQNRQLQLLQLCEKHPNTLNENVWIKNIASPLIKSVENTLKTTNREALDMVYDIMTDKFGFYPCCARNEYKDKYGVTDISVLSAIADSPTYKQAFAMAVNQIITNCNKTIEKNQIIPYYLDEFDKVVYPLAKKLKDSTPYCSYTLRRVYSKIKTPQGWKNTRTRNKCLTNKAVIMRQPQLFKTFVKTVNRMMEETL